MPHVNSLFSALVIDAEEPVGRLLAARLAERGGHAQWAPNRSTAFDLVAGKPSVDMIFFDPAPYRDTHRVAIDIQKQTASFTYLVALRGDQIVTAFDQVAQTGVNATLSKPVPPELLDQVIADARTLMTLLHRLNDPLTDTKSGGGVIAKSAFAQLFLSALDRADRYAEQAFILEVNIHNTTQIRAMAGADTAVQTSAILAHAMTRLRRQSDILGAVDEGAFILMLQRPAYSTEPMDAALRFADQLTDPAFWAGLNIPVPVEIQVRLTEIPTGHVHAAHDIVVKKA